MSETSRNDPSRDSGAGDVVASTGSESDTDRVLARYTVANALGEAGFGDVFVLSHEAAERALTESRREILNTLATTTVESQGELARRLDRDPGNVGRDIDILVEEGLLERVQNGRAKRPVLTHDTYVVEPVVGAAPDRHDG
jgi:predicted transcriptional regulator